MSPSKPLSLRKKVAKEAANLLYFGVEKEYKQAKLRAAKTFAAHFLPANREVAIEFDRIADENEGTARQKRLTRIRKEALKIMRMLEEFNPVLIGSVWRGTIHYKSDIDILVYHDEKGDILKVMKQNNLRVMRTEQMAVTKQGLKKMSFHIYLESPTKEKVDRVVRNSEEDNCKEKCEIYGDAMTGLRIKELENVLEENPTQRFVPF